MKAEPQLQDANAACGYVPAKAEDTETVSPASDDAKSAGLRHAAMKGGVYLIGRHAISIILKLAGLLLITRVLGPEGYGAYISGLNIYQYAALLGQTGIGVYLLRYEGELSDKAYRTAYTMLAVLSLFLVTLFEASTTSLSLWIDVPGFGAVMQIIILALPFQLLAMPASVKLERNLDYRSVALLEILGQLTYYILAVPMVMAGFGPVSLALAWLLQQATSFLAAHVMARSFPRFGFDRTTACNIARYAAQFSFAAWIWQLRMLVNPMVVGPALGAQAVGLIGMTIGLLEMLSIIKTVVWRLSIAIFAKVQNDCEKLRRAVQEGMELQTLTVGAILLGFGWTGQFIIPWLFGPRWTGVMDLYPYLALAYFTNAIFNMHSSALSVLCRNRELAVFHLIHVSIFAGAVILLVPYFGKIGYGIGELVALISYSAVHIYLARAVGKPRYIPAAIWWLGCAAGLFWQTLGLWAIALPFLALAFPPSPAYLLAYYYKLRKS